MSAVDAAGNESAQSAAVTVVYDKTGTAHADQPPAAATPTNAKPALDWDSGGSDTLTGLDHYEVYRGAALVGCSATTAYTDTSLSSSGSHSYTVKAVDGAGNHPSPRARRVVIFDVVAPRARPRSPRRPRA